MTEANRYETLPAIGPGWPDLNPLISIKEKPMSDSDEAVDGLVLALEQACILHNIKPNHHLLRYVTFSDNDATWEEFVAKFGKPGITREEKRSAPAVAYMYAQLYLSLRDACENPDAEIVFHHAATELDEFW